MIRKLLICGAIAAAIGLGVRLIQRRQAAPGKPPQVEARLVGSQACISCHLEEAQAWRGSHHDLAMQEPRPETVLGNFDNAVFEQPGLRAQFRRRAGVYLVETQNESGTPTEYRVASVFGVAPLQQLILELPRGHLAAFSVAWDSRPKAKGGQRWFSLYPDESPRFGAALHWAGPHLNWNSMCAECHLTHYRKNHDRDRDRYESAWSEPDVGCEACHGPASLHLQWAQKHLDEEEFDEADPKGLVRKLRGSGDETWSFVAETGNVRRNTALPPPTQVETCARCHSRRSTLSEDFPGSGRLMDTHVPELLSEGLYYADGQIKDEVYVYGSFLQSQMHRKGVVCSDCHDPHRLEIKSKGNGLCFRCHRPEHFESVEHHHHDPGSAGARCVACHMPTRTYMGVDVRRDHSIRVPRPDLSLRYGTPNACNACHQKQDAQWASDAIAAWSTPQKPKPFHFVEVLAPARNQALGITPQLIDLARNQEQPGIARATAFTLLSEHAGPKGIAAAKEATQSKDPLIRLAAANWLARLDAATTQQILRPLLRDPRRALRSSVARGLALQGASIPPAWQRPFQAALKQYREEQALNSDRAASDLNLGTLDLALGRFQEAERSFRQAMARPLPPVEAWVNLADLQRLGGDEHRCQKTLQDARARFPKSGAAAHALALALIRSGAGSDALPLLKSAHRLAPRVPRYSYVYAVALHSYGRGEEALSLLRKAQQELPGSWQLLYGLATINRDLGHKERAQHWATLLETEF